MTPISRILFHEEIPRGRPIYIYGAGANGRALRAVLAAAHFDEVVAFIDTQQDGVVDGLRCLSLSTYVTRRHDGDVILIASSYAKEMRTALAELGVTDAIDASGIWSVLLHQELAAHERFLRRHQPPGIAFDIGANEGLVARILRRRASEVHVFEPNEALRSALNFSFDGLSGFHVVHRAVADRIGTATFYVSGDSGSTESSLSAHVPDVQHKVEVETTTIDAYCEEAGVAPSTIKVDVERLEPDVIRGGWTTIRRHRPVLLIEFQKAGFEQAYREMLAELATLYRVVRVPPLDDPDAGCAYVDALEYYRTHDPERKTVSLGCLPKTT